MDGVERIRLDAEPQRLARLLALDEAEVAPWGRRELAAVLDHQLSAPLRLGIVGSGPDLSAAAQILEGERCPTLDTFEKVFFDPLPPVELLRLVKDFAKAHLAACPARLPVEVAGVLYLAAIAAGMSKCHERISRLDDEELRRGLTWAVGLDWVDDRLKAILRAALSSLG